MTDSNQKSKIIEGLKEAYKKELESVLNYLPNSINLDGLKAEELKEHLDSEVDDELGHAKKLANRIKDLGGDVPGSFEFHFSQKSLQPPQDNTDLKSVIQGVIEAEKDAIQHYEHLINITDGVDHVTQDLVITILEDEQNHLRVFSGFLKDFE